MPTTIDGATVAVQLDLGDPPFILDRDRLGVVGGSELTPAAEAYSDITCEILFAEWTRGAAVANGILTDTQTGRAAFTFADPGRILDPLNPDAAKARVGAYGRVLVDGEPAFSGLLASTTHDLGGGTSEVVLLDAFSRLQQQSISIAWAAGTTAAQLAAVLDAMAWPVAERVIYGAPASSRLADPFVGTGFEAVTRLRDAELGDLWIDGAGRLAFRTRNQPAPSEIRAVIGCGGIDLETLVTESRRIGLVNHVLVDMDDPDPDRVWQTPQSVGLFGRRSYKSAEADLRFS
jgi:hypothetical protein